MVYNNMNWVFVIILCIVFYFLYSSSEGYHNPLHYNKQRDPDIESYRKLTVMPRSPDYRGY